MRKILRSFGSLISAGSAALAWLLLAAAVPAVAQQPRITDGKVETRSAASDLKKVFASLVAAQTSPAWIGYGVSSVSSRNHMCCYDGDMRGGIPRGRGC
jgi:hypothetical protein